MTAASAPSLSELGRASHEKAFPTSEGGARTEQHQEIAARRLTTNAVRCRVCQQVPLAAVVAAVAKLAHTKMRRFCRASNFRGRHTCLSSLPGQTLR